MPPTPQTPSTIKTTIVYLDQQLTEQELVIEVPFSPAASIADALARFNGDESVLLAAANSALEDRAVKEAQKTAAPGAINKTHALALANPFRAMFPTKKEGGSLETRAEQTAACFKFIAGNSQMLEALMKLSA